jgi:serine/threonine-protein kinase RsbW
VRVESTFRGHVPAFAEVRAWTEAFGAAVGADRTAALRLVLVLEELFTNTVAHGYAGGTEGPIWIALASRPGGIEVTYEDAGPAFDPFAPLTPTADVRAEHPALEERPAGGLGLALVRGLCVAPSYARVGARNRITFTVPRNDLPAAPAAASG